MANSREAYELMQERARELQAWSSELLNNVAAELERYQRLANDTEGAVRQPRSNTAASARSTDRPLQRSAEIQPHIFAITPRQWEVACLVAQGYTNDEIAAKLTITRGSVANHMARILERLGLRSRVDLAVWAVVQVLSADEHRPVAPGA